MSCVKAKHKARRNYEGRTKNVIPVFLTKFIDISFRCDLLDILLEMYRILRPEGAAVIRDHVDIIVKVKGITDKMRWNGKIFHSENGPFHSEKILLLDNSE